MQVSRPATIVLACLLVVTIGCRDHVGESPTAVVAPREMVRIVEGDHQFGLDRDTLEQPVVALVTDLAGKPLANVEVIWSVNDNGWVYPESQTTDAEGRVRAFWRLGVADDHNGSVRVRSGAGAPFTASEGASRTLELQEVDILRPRTYEGSRQTVHPDFARTPADWGAYSLHLALTPYPNGLTEHENPSVYVSRKGNHWFPEPGVSNPLVVPALDEGYLSDPDLVYVPESRELWMYYRRADSRNRVFVVRSANGVNWSEPRQILSAVNHSIISPSIVRRGPKEWRMWSVNGGAGGCNGADASVQVRTSRDGLRWSKAYPANMRGGDLKPWHLDVQWIPALNEYWALYPVKIPFTCATRALYLATSRDGLFWTSYPTPVLQAGEVPELRDIVYRSSFEYDAEHDEVTFWFSGANHLGGFNYDWRTVSQRRRRDDLFARIRSEAPLAGLNQLPGTIPVMINPP